MTLSLQLLDLEKDKLEKIPDEIQNSLFDYRLESNLPHITAENIQIIADSLVLYNVIEKRKAELDDLAKGMESISLMSFLKKNVEVSGLLFPRTVEKVVDVESLKLRIQTEGKLNDSDEKAKMFFMQYIDELQSRNPQGTYMYGGTIVYIFLIVFI
jgi:hypothetical protein